MSKVSSVLRNFLNMAVDIVLGASSEGPIAIGDIFQFWRSPVWLCIFCMVPHVDEAIQFQCCVRFDLYKTWNFGITVRDINTLSIIPPELPAVEGTFYAVFTNTTSHA